MKSKLFVSLSTAVLTLSGITQGAVTISIKNFTSVVAGVPVVDAAGAAVAKNTIYASAGIFTSMPNWTTNTAAQVLGQFVALDATPLTNSGFTGLFSGNDSVAGLASYPANFSGAASYILVGNAPILANSTAIAVYSTGSTFTPVDGGGNANVALNGTTPANWVYGAPRSVTVHPGVASAAFTSGIVLSPVAIPEPSAALLGALGVLGLLRRRRI
jgi:hypothetical protein